MVREVYHLHVNQADRGWILNGHDEKNSPLVVFLENLDLFFYEVFEAKHFIVTTLQIARALRLDQRWPETR